ncbi:uncharacterized protein SAPINGB_P000048 [Magnusiomyces paraingens]|uniref:Glutathione S-transferase n=1 Tax=Magnusiomyces paraingens TaxID=2606893 RepID=A0A5E8AYA5_9ASCO|nr:uncharacterized protein SAPINGB_P000048 [Saprochaete ingens]VVT43579.1 unnamed protein product [Saprochaete ingens]
MFENIPLEMRPTPTGITLYGFIAPNAVKVSIALQILGVKYTVRNINILKGIQKSPWYVELNPEGTVPTLVDAGDGSSSPIVIWESGAILQYLLSKYDPEGRVLGYPVDSAEYPQQLSWLFFQVSEAGALQLQANRHFVFPSKKDTEQERNLLKTRYIGETRRIYRLLERHLAARAKSHAPGDDPLVLVGSRVCVADIAHIGWITMAFLIGIDVPSEFPHITKWIEHVIAQKGVVQGLDASGPWFGFSRRAPWKRPGPDMRL